MGWRRRKRKNQFVEEEGEGMLVDFGQDEVVGEEEEGEGLEGFEGYWKGDGSLGGFGGGSEEEQRLNRMFLSLFLFHLSLSLSLSLSLFLSGNKITDRR